MTAGDGVPLFELIFMIYFTLCFMFSLFVYCYVAEVLRKEVYCYILSKLILTPLLFILY